MRNLKNFIEEGEAGFEEFQALRNELRANFLD